MKYTEIVYISYNNINGLYQFSVRTSTTVSAIKEQCQREQLRKQFPERQGMSTMELFEYLTLYSRKTNTFLEQGGKKYLIPILKEPSKTISKYNGKYSLNDINP